MVYDAEVEYWHGGGNHEFFYPRGRERVQIPEGRAYVKILYQAYDLLKKNKSAHVDRFEICCVFPPK
jgi:hypothetical protein